ncbi:PHD finger protein 24 isoform X3 [Scyliorhinus canicula]|uniref:PHD finger protein 24 isoform X3 n=1 Tax=Scyliorhinus canicula TaxID=7830 RepID=UPI0018F63BE0|nr:PHD finger protein 24 isoform X3 [Scyliorhinus canicula]
MGVLMSKKQAVEQVQKASVVVSAFKDGLKDKGSTRNKAEPARGNAEDPGQQNAEAAGGSRPGTEEAKRNQTAWERLRDGKGMEPEELEWNDEATPPAFVRPKRQLGDDESLDIKLREEGEDNVNLLLTDEEMFSLKEVLRQCRIIPESCLTLDDFLHYKHFIHKQVFDEQMNEEKEELVVLQFSALDGDKKGQMEWTDFLYHESLLVLQRFRPENSLLRLLTAKERARARSCFLGLDQTGLITGTECKRAQNSWFHKNSLESQSCNVSISHVGPISESSPASRGRGRPQDKSLLCREQEENRRVDWKTFLKENAIYILAARPNSAAIHLRPAA